VLDSQYSVENVSNHLLDHKYGEKVHIFSNPFSLTLLEKLSSKETIQPDINFLVENLYRYLLFQVMGYAFPTETVVSPTRMSDLTEKGVYQGVCLRKDQPIVCVNLARAGTFPSHIFYSQLNYYFSPSGIRQDHFYCNRKVDENNQVVGVDVSGSKIGGGVEDAIVIFPDPMGATGGTLCEAIRHYKEQVEGKARKYIAVHLIVTPEYIKRMQTTHPDVEIYALRLDRGFSGKDVLASTPGEYWDKEVGLNDIQYIVPGAGGVGEILNNSFV
jgi:uracil phosphoribosyltransferase